MSDNVVWLAAYPKTGSTWVRTILQQLLSPDARGRQAIPSFKRDYPVEAPSHEVMGGSAKVLRTHCHPEHGVFRAIQDQRDDIVTGILTIQRHPLDVLLSQLNYAYIRELKKTFKDGRIKRAEDIIADGEIDYYIDTFVQADGCPEYLARCRTYPDFYLAWRAFAPAARHLHLCYEKMVEHPAAAIEDLNKFLELPQADPDAVIQKVENLTQKNGKFFWRKQAYNHRSLLPVTSIRRFERAYADRLNALGYES